MLDVVMIYDFYDFYQLLLCYCDLLMDGCFALILA